MQAGWDQTPGKCAFHTLIKKLPLLPSGERADVRWGARGKWQAPCVSIQAGEQLSGLSRTHMGLLSGEGLAAALVSPVPPHAPKSS